MLTYESLSPKEFFDIIPTDIIENIEFRIKFHKLCAASKELQNWYLDCCREYLPIIFNSMFFTMNPQRPPEESNQPFILRPKQVPAVEILDWCIKNKHDAAIDKAREEGATEIVTKIYSAFCILYENRSFIVGSRKKELVDSSEDDYTIFAKIDNAFKFLPKWLGFNYTGIANNRIYRKDMTLKVLKTNSGVFGETTNENFSASKRGTSIFLDEIGRVEKSIADSIEGSIHDVSNCVIYGSTHWLGVNHTFNKVLHKPSTKVIIFDWFENPEKNPGLYTSPKPGIVELLDVDYYKKYYPELLKYAC